MASSFIQSGTKVLRNVGIHLELVGSAIERSGQRIVKNSNSNSNRNAASLSLSATNTTTEQLQALRAKLVAQGKDKTSTTTNFFVAPDVWLHNQDGSVASEKDISLGKSSSIWYNARIGDAVKVGEKSNIQEGAVIAKNTTIGSFVSIGPRANIGSGVKIDDRSFIGAGAVIGDKCKISSDTWIAPGAVIPNGTTIASGAWEGNPAKKTTDYVPEYQSVISATAAFVSQAANYHGGEWDKSELERHNERQKFLDREFYSTSILEDHPDDWELYSNVELNPVKNPERRGLIFDKE